MQILACQYYITQPYGSIFLYLASNMGLHQVTFLRRNLDNKGEKRDTNMNIVNSSSNVGG